LISRGRPKRVISQAPELYEQKIASPQIAPVITADIRTASGDLGPDWSQKSSKSSRCPRWRTACEAGSDTAPARSGSSGRAGGVACVAPARGSMRATVPGPRACSAVARAGAGSATPSGAASRVAASRSSGTWLAAASARSKSTSHTWPCLPTITVASARSWWAIRAVRRLATCASP
jgi:hypothetical protein